ncbi:hypothetical protein ACHAWF_009323 [Thalassiosira exigua]
MPPAAPRDVVARGAPPPFPRRLLSSSAAAPPAAGTPPPPPPDAVHRPPDSLTPEAGLGAQDAMRLFVRHGPGRRRLEAVAADKGRTPLVERWQRMVEAYLVTQCHVISLLGYPPDEKGLGAYTQQLSDALKLSSPDVQESLRVAGRDTYRMVLAAAFDLPLAEEMEKRGELSVVDARNIMHKVSLRMQDPEVLEKVAKECATSAAMDDSPEAKQLDLARRHTAVQWVMVNDVYLSESGEGGVTLVQECGFGEGEDGYVRMQAAMAEHQADPLISQYVGAAMVRLLQSAGIDVGAMQGGQSA